MRRRADHAHQQPDRAPGKAGGERLLEAIARGTALPDVLEGVCCELEAVAPGWISSVAVLGADGTAVESLVAPHLPAPLKASTIGWFADDSHPCTRAARRGEATHISNVASQTRWSRASWARELSEHELKCCSWRPVGAGPGQTRGVISLYRRAAEAGRPDPAPLQRLAVIAGLAIERAQSDATLRAREAELRQAYGFLNEAQRLSRTGSFTWDALTGHETWSDELYRIFEMDPQTQVSVSLVSQIIHPEDLPLLRETTARAVAGEETDYFFRIVTPRGRVKHFHAVSHRSEQVSDRPVFIGAIQDVTEAKEAEEALDRARNELAHVARMSAMSALSASIVHEVNQPLAGILTNAGTCQRLLDAEKPDLAAVRATAQRIARDGARAADVIRRLRAMFSREGVQTGAVDLNEAATEVVSLIAAQMQRNGVAITTALAPELPLLQGDRVQLQQVILNLLTNAADAGRAAGASPPTVELRTDCNEGTLTVAVRDCGGGIAPEILPRVFEPFFTTKPDGMGIGLFVSRSIVESHSGRLWAVANTNGPGMTFGFSLPAAPAEGSSSPSPNETFV